jgi:hypothetical protein
MLRCTTSYERSRGGCTQPGDSAVQLVTEQFPRTNHIVHPHERPRIDSNARLYRSQTPFANTLTVSANEANRDYTVA